MGPKLRAQLLLATGLGCGYAPIAPGTFGSALGLLAYAAAWAAGGTAATLAGTATVVLLGFWSSGKAAAHFGQTDPGRVVIDEVAGQMLALLLLPATTLTWAAGFLVFRALDIVKPFPARRLEALPGASGIMTDDLVAGLYTNLLLQLLGWGFPALLAWA